MPRRQATSRSAAKRRISTTRLVLYIISLVVILSMVIGFVIEVSQPPVYQAGPTPAPIASPAATPAS